MYRMARFLPSPALPLAFANTARSSVGHTPSSFDSHLFQLKDVWMTEQFE